MTEERYRKAATPETRKGGEPAHPSQEGHEDHDVYVSVRGNPAREAAPPEPTPPMGEPTVLGKVSGVDGDVHVALPDGSEHYVPPGVWAALRSLTAEHDELAAEVERLRGGIAQVDQDVFGPKGNCLTAGLATLLGRPLNDLRDIQQIYDDGADEWERTRNANVMNATWDRVNEALRKKFAVRALQLCPPLVPKGYALLGGNGPRGHAHYVVGFDGEMVFDPHPSRAGLVGSPTDYLVLVPLVPNPHGGDE